MATPYSKRELTAIFLKELGITTNSDKELMNWVWAWWVNPPSPSSMQLTKAGSQLLSDSLKLKQYSITLKDDTLFTSKVLLHLDRYLTSPFYLANRKKMIVYGETDSIMLTLYGGDLLAYLESLVANR